MIKFTEEQKNFIYQNYKGIGNKELTKMFNDKFNTNYDQQIKRFKNNHHLDSGLNGQYQKGNIPINKGTKGMFNVGGNSTSFKKGNKSYNCDPIGTEKWKSDGFLYVKVADGKLQHNWKQKHRILWKNKYGPIPKNHKIIFTNGDRTDIRIENLILVSNSQMLIMNRQKLIYKDSESTKVGVTIAKVLDKVNKLKR